MEGMDGEEGRGRRVKDKSSFIAFFSLYTVSSHLLYVSWHLRVRNPDRTGAHRGGGSGVCMDVFRSVKRMVRTWTIDKCKMGGV